MIDKSWTKKDLLEVIKVYQIDIEDPKELPKKKLSEELYFQLINTDEIFDWNCLYQDVNRWSDLVDLLEKPKANTDLDYRQKQEMIHDAKVVLNYCRNGYLLTNTSFKDFDELYLLALKVSQHGDISTCRRAIAEFNKDKKLRNKIEPKISQKMQNILEQKKINKQELIPKLVIRKEPIRLTFD
jgi:hypothetical protein|tara:strand:+ start:206 stop:757 length:552 start_codon:yes stop_codon:yes gene_type:complete